MEPFRKGSEERIGHFRGSGIFESRFDQSISGFWTGNAGLALRHGSQVFLMSAMGPSMRCTRLSCRHRAFRVTFNPGVQST